LALLKPPGENLTKENPAWVTEYYATKNQVGDAIDWPSFKQMKEDQQQQMQNWKTKLSSVKMDDIFDAFSNIMNAPLASPTMVMHPDTWQLILKHEAYIRILELSTQLEFPFVEDELKRP